MPKKISLYHALKSSYATEKKQKKAFTKHGYNYDDKLSNHNQQVYHNKNTNDLIVNVTGTHNLKDWGTDAYLALGKLKDTNRYKEADRVFKEAKNKYNPNNTKVFGNSLGGSIAGYIAGANDKVYTHNKGATIGQKIRPNETHFRTNNDLISLLNSRSDRTVNLKNDNFIKDPYNAHLVSSLRNKKIKV
jgi:hypothetical protein